MGELNEKYLANILEQQKLTQNQLTNLRNLRSKIEKQLREGLNGSPIFYYSGSYGKKTIISEAYDLDIVVYFPKDTEYSLKNIFVGVGNVLKRHWNNAHEKSVGWELSFKGNFHIDIVPGRALDTLNKYANLYNARTGQPLKTSIKVHIDTISNSGRREIIKLVKLWKIRKKLPFKSFLLEQMVIEGCKGKRKDQLEKQLLAAFDYIYKTILHGRFVDPANTNNVISSLLTNGQKTQIRNYAKRAIDAKLWSEVFSGI